MSTMEELPLHLRGNWAPLTEERTITDLTVTGHRLPRFLTPQLL